MARRRNGTRRAGINRTTAAGLALLGTAAFPGFPAMIPKFGGRRRSTRKGRRASRKNRK